MYLGALNRNLPSGSFEDTNFIQHSASTELCDSAIRGFLQSVVVLGKNSSIDSFVEQFVVLLSFHERKVFILALANIQLNITVLPFIISFPIWENSANIKT